MDDDTDAAGTDEGPRRPRFRGCVFCYSAEWALYAGRRAARAVRE